MSLPFKSSEVIKNLSNYELTTEEEEILKNGLDYSIPPFKMRKTDVFYSYELLCRYMCSNLKDSKDSEIIRSELSHLAHTYVNFKPGKSSLKKHSILKKLKANNKIIITKPDKGTGVVIIDKDVYVKSMRELLSDSKKFKILKEDLTIYRQGQLQRRLLKLKKKGFFNQETYNKIYPNGSKPARLYGLPKMHKTFEHIPPFRPIVSSIGTFNHKLASFLGDLVKKVIPIEHSCSDTFNFLDELSKHDTKGKFTVSFDVCSLFTNIPLNETLDLAVSLILKNEPNLKITSKELRELFDFATSKNNFLFQGVIYDQVDGISMGSPLAPILANLFMGFNEKIWLEEYQGTKPQFYKRYVDDIFAIFANEDEASKFFDFLNTRHPNIKFTKEYNENGVLPFLDISISNVSSFSTSVYHKPTFTGVLLNFKSFAPFEYKTRLINTLLDRIYKINSSWKGFDLDVKKLSSYLLRNLYPKRLIDKYIKRFLDKKLAVSTQSDNTKNKDEKEIRYIKLPYIGEFSKTVKTKIDKLIKRFCKENVQVRLIFTTFKIKNYFSTKDVTPKCFMSSVVYRFLCAICNDCYVGRTHVYFNTRQREHFETDLNSAIYKHFAENQNCITAKDFNSFSILDQANTRYELALKEAMHIKWLNPKLNEQKRHEIIRLLI